MRICHVVYSYYPFDPRVRKEAEALAALGYDVDVIAVRDEGERRSEVVGRVHVFRLPMTIMRGRRLRYIYQYALFLALSTALLFRLCLFHRYAVIHVHSLPDFQVFCTVPDRLLGARVVLDLHEAMPEILQARFDLASHHPFVALARVAERLSARYADRVVVATEQRERLLASRGVEPHKMVIVMNSPDEETLAGRPTNDLRSELGLEGRRVLVQAGGVNQERDLEVLIRAAGLLSTQYPISLILVGRGDPVYLDRLRTVAAASPELDFRIGGWVNQSVALQFVRLSEVGLVTYEKNPLTELAAPHKVLEYVAAGKPLVLADLEGLRSVWNGGALFYRPGDAADLASKIQQVFRDPELGTSLTEKARKMSAQLDWHHSRNVLQEMYKSLERGTR